MNDVKGQVTEQESTKKSSKLTNFFKELRRHPRVISIYMVSLIIFIAVGFSGGWYFTKDNNQPVILSYDECVAAGYPVAESYPEQCFSPDGQSFTRELTEKEINEQKAIEEMTFPESKYVTVLPESISLKYPGDEDKLPVETPYSFVQYMKANLVDNPPNDVGCITEYVIDMISPINISGGIRGAAPADNPEKMCGGAAAMYWYFKDNKWEHIGLQGTMLCEGLIDRPIYGQFIPICDDNTKNPNGSIDDAL